MPLIELPADVTLLMMQEVYGYVSDVYQETLWTASRTKQMAAGLKWTLRFDGMPLSEFQRQVFLQSRSDLAMEGGRWGLYYRDRGTAATVLTDRSLLGEPTFGFAPPRTELVTRVTVLWDYDGDGSPRKSQELVSDRERRLSIQRGRLAATDEPKKLELTFVRDDATALRMGQYHLAQWDRQHLITTIKLAWEGLAFEKGDLFTFGHPVTTPWGTPWFRVQSKHYDLDNDEITLEGVEEVGAVKELSAQAKVRLLRSVTRTAEARLKPVKVLGAEARPALPSLVFRRPPLHLTTR